MASDQIEVIGAKAAGLDFALLRRAASRGLICNGPHEAGKGEPF
jgi:hypothetical protein